MDLAPFGGGEFEQGLADIDAGVVDQNVRRGGVAGDGLGEAGDLGFIGHVRRECPGTDAEFARAGGGLLEAREIAGHQDDIGASAGQGEGDFAAEAAAGAGDQGGFSF